MKALTGVCQVVEGDEAVKDNEKMSIKGRLRGEGKG